jgi:uncharacterized protein (DUF58 family)
MVIGPPLFIALGFFLAVIAVESLVLLVSARVSSAIIVPGKVRTFKHEMASATLQVGTVRSKLLGTRKFVVLTPYGLECAIGEVRGGSGDLTLVPSLAGRFDDLSLKLMDGDILGLFARESVVNLEGFVLESLPSSLRAPARPIVVSPISLGDIPAGRRGGGQEMHAVEEYHPGLDSKDVIWRRVAQSPTEELTMRARESSIRRSVSIGLAISWESEASRAVLFDLTAEALAQIGKALIELGTAVRFSYVSQGRFSFVESTRLSELADATLVISETDNGGLQTKQSVSESDIIVSEIRNYLEKKLLSGSRDELILLISETPKISASRDRIFVYSGSEDLTAVVESVIET